MCPKKDFLRLVIDREKADSPIKGVYLVTDDGEKLLQRVKQAISGGVRVVQYRNKTGSAAGKFARAMELKQYCARTDVCFIINDDLELAKRLDADGLHLGQDDGCARAAREQLGPKKIIGVSTHSVAEAVKAEADGADYIGFGAIFPTASKNVEHMPGPLALKQVKASVKVPVVAIGGINRDNAAEVIDNGADAIAVISAILGSNDPELSATELSLLFNRRAPFPRGSVLTIAGSDSGGGAGIQADLKTTTLLGSYGASVITALTAQNTRGVTGIHGVPGPFVTEQLRAVLSDIPVDVIKTGMLYSAEIIAAIHDLLQQYHKRLVVVDPVMVAKGGADLIEHKALACFKKRLLPAAYLLTPNVPEAEKLTGLVIRNEGEMEEAARALCTMGARNVLIKGGHLQEGTAVDILHDGNGFIRFPAQRILTKNTHGTGCTLASAIAAFLAQGDPLPLAVARAKDFITAAIKLAQPLGKGHGPVNHYLGAKSLEKNLQHT